MLSLDSKKTHYWGHFMAVVLMEAGLFSPDPVLRQTPFCACGRDFWILWGFYEGQDIELRLKRCGCGYSSESQSQGGVWVWPYVAIFQTVFLISWSTGPLFFWDQQILRWTNEGPVRIPLWSFWLFFLFKFRNIFKNCKSLQTKKSRCLKRGPVFQPPLDLKKKHCFQRKQTHKRKFSSSESFAYVL